MRAHQVYIPRKNIPRVQSRKGTEIASENEIKAFMMFMDSSIDAFFSFQD